MSTVQAIIGEDTVSSDILEFDIWRESLKVGRWELVLKNEDNKYAGDLVQNDVSQLKINDVPMLIGYVDDPYTFLAKKGVYTNLMNLKGRDYGRDLARLYATANFVDVKADDVLEKLLSITDSEITYTSPQAAPLVNVDKARTYLIDWLEGIAPRFNYDAYVDDAKALHFFLYGHVDEETGVTLKLVSGATDNNILDLLKGEDLGLSIANEIEVTAGPLEDHYTDGNAVDFDSEANTTVENEPNTMAKVVANAPTSTVFKTDLPKAVDDWYKGLNIIFRSGNLENEKSLITGYVGASKQVTVSPAFSQVPEVDDDVTIEGSIVGTSSLRMHCSINCIPWISLDFSGNGLYSHAGLDLSSPREMSYYNRHKSTQALSNIRPRLKDKLGTVIEFKRGGIFPLPVGVADKGRTDIQAHNKWHKVKIPLGESEENIIKDNETPNFWYYISGSSFDWANVVEIKWIINPASGGAASYWIDNLCIPSVEVRVDVRNQTSIDAHGRSMWHDDRPDIRSQIELQVVAEEELKARKDPVKTIRVFAKGQTGTKYSGQSVEVLAPDHGIAAATKYRILKLHHQVRKEAIMKGENFITTYDLVKHEMSPTAQHLRSLRYNLSNDPYGTLIEILSLTRRRTKGSRGQRRPEFGDTHPASTVFYSGSGTVFPLDPADGFVFVLTADIPSTHLAGGYTYVESQEIWVRQPAIFRRAANPTYGQYEGDINDNTTDGKIYQWDGDSWEFIGTSDHGTMEGLDGDDHTQYHTTARHAAIEHVASMLNQAIQPYNSNIEFTRVVDSEHNAIHYTLGNITFQDGTTRSITPAANLTDLPVGYNYIYFKTDSASLFATQVHGDAISAGRGLLAIILVSSADDPDVPCSIQTFYSKGLNITADVISCILLSAIASELGSVNAAGGAVRIDDDGINIIDDAGGNFLIFRKADESIKGAIYKDTDDYIIIHSTDARIRMRGNTVPLIDGGFDLGLDVIRWGHIYGDNLHGRYFVPITTLGSRPAAAAGVVGLLWQTRTAAGHKTYTWQCVQNDANGYEWIQTGVST